MRENQRERQNISLTISVGPTRQTSRCKHEEPQLQEENAELVAAGFTRSCELSRPVPSAPTFVVHETNADVPNSTGRRFRDVIAEQASKRSAEERKTKIDTTNDFLWFGGVSEPPTKKAAKAIPESLSLALEDIDHRAPWARGRKYLSKSKDRTACLHEEILDFVDFISPTAAENKRRSVLLQHFQRITKVLWPSAALHVYGSYATGLHLPSSDIDCVVLGCNDPNALQALASVIRASTASRCPILDSPA